VLRGKLLISLVVAGLLAGGSGCSLIVPVSAHRPVIRNPFPQLSRVAIAPFFNQSDEPTVDGRQVAMAYFAELQSTPGFEVVPLGVVEEAIIEHQIDLSGPNEARRLAQILGVDAVAVGSITDYSEYYPPRIGLRVEWYAANPGFHEIPAGYGLPWDTPEEEFIPDSLVYESQMALAREQMAGMTPDCDAACQMLPAPPTVPLDGAPAPELDQPGVAPQSTEEPAAEDPSLEPPAPAPAARLHRDPRTGNLVLAQATEELPLGPTSEASADAATAANAADATTLAIVTPAPAAPGAACEAAPLATCERPPCIPQYGPVLSHTRIYRGNDADLTEALEGYVYFRDDHRFGGWKSYLSRSEDFVRFCCHMHICEMLSARGGSRKTQVVWRWPESR
jgi:hypothetical protein